jgi:hypothetical protein
MAPAPPVAASGADGWPVADAAKPAAKPAAPKASEVKAAAKPAAAATSAVVAPTAAPAAKPTMVVDSSELAKLLLDQSAVLASLAAKLDEQKRVIDSQQNAIRALETKGADAPKATPVSATPALAVALPPPPPAAAAVATSMPLTIRLGDADFLIGGFMDATSVSRSANLGSGLGTAFGSVPLSNTPQGGLSETRFSTQNSRLTLQATSKVGGANVKGYLEADFLGFQPTNGFVTSNSNSLRMRLYWAQVTKGKVEFLAGQSWSFLTPNRNGLSPTPGDLFYSQDVDTNYQVGLPWGRTTGFRVVVHPTGTLSAGVAVENPQQYVGGAVVMPAAFPAAEVDNNGNTSTPNSYPDVIAKVAFDPKTGRLHQHFEFANIVRGFKTYDSTSNQTYTATGTGQSASAVLEPFKNVRLIGTAFTSHGGGRYLMGLGPDFIINADSSLSLVDAKSAIAGAELQVTPKTLVYGYDSFAQFDQAVTVDKNGKAIGFGVPGSTSANRMIREVTFGVTQTFFKDPRYGAFQLMLQGSYLKRSLFAGAPAGAPSDAALKMFYVNVRYVLP